jgi:hypothetical protein
MMLGRCNCDDDVTLVNIDERSAMAPAEKPNSAAPDSIARLSLRQREWKWIDFIVNLDSGKAGAFKAILFCA